MTACHNYAASVSWMFVDVRVKVHETYYCDLLLSLQLAYVRSLASSYFSKTMPRHTRHTSFQKLIFHNSVVMDFRYGEIFNNRLIPNFSRCTVRIILGLVVGIAHVAIGTVGIAPVGIALVGIGTASRYSG